MKNLVLMTIAFSALVASQCYAQRSELTGHSAKNRTNRHAEMHPTTIMVIHHNHQWIAAPKAKNSKPWADDCKTFPMVFVKRKDLPGPKAKNSRPGADDFQPLPVVFAKQKNLQDPKGRKN